MFKKVFGNVLNAITLAFMGYEAGSHMGKNEKEESISHSSIESVKQEQVNHNEIIIIVSIIIVILLLAAVASKILFGKGRLV